MTSSPAAPHSGPAHQRAIVWLPAGAVPPATLVESLRKRDVPVTVADSPLIALAHACASHNAAAVDGTLVVLCEAPTLPNIAETVVAMRRYAASAVIYVYQPGARQTLREVETQDLVDWGAPEQKPIHRDGTHPPHSPVQHQPLNGPMPLAMAEPAPMRLAPAPPPPAPTIKSAPSLRLTEPMPRVEPARNESPAAPEPIVRDDAPPADVLSADELAMLLGRDNPEERP